MNVDETHSRQKGDCRSWRRRAKENIDVTERHGQQPEESKRRKQKEKVNLSM